MNGDGWRRGMANMPDNPTFLALVMMTSFIPVWGLAGARPAAGKRP